METNITNLGKLLAAISKIKTPSFVRVLNYSNDKGNGEVADYTFNLGISYENAKVSDTDYLRNPKNIEGLDFGKLKPFSEEARALMLEANLNPDNKQSQAQSDAYVTVCPNVRVHKETGRVFIYGFVISKDVKVQGSYKKVNSAPLTLAKNIIRKELRTNKFRQVAFDKLDTVRVKGQELEILIG